MKKKITNVGEAAWVTGNIICAIGNCFVAKGAFGVAAIIAPAFVLNRVIGVITVGVSEYIIQGILLVLCCLTIKKFKGKFIATICNILFYGACFDLIDSMLGFIQPSTLQDRIVVCVVGTLFTTFGVAMMLRTYIPPSAYEIFVKEISEEKGMNMNKFKFYFDGMMVGLAIVGRVAFLGEITFDLIGPLTIISAFMNSVLIAFFGKILDKYVDFSPAIPRLYERLNPKAKNKD